MNGKVEHSALALPSVATSGVPSVSPLCTDIFLVFSEVKHGPSMCVVLPYRVTQGLQSLHENRHIAYRAEVPI